MCWDTVDAQRHQDLSKNIQERCMDHPAPALIHLSTPTLSQDLHIMLVLFDREGDPRHLASLTTSTGLPEPSESPPGRSPGSSVHAVSRSPRGHMGGRSAHWWTAGFLPKGVIKLCFFPNSLGGKPLLALGFGFPKKGATFE